MLQKLLAVLAMYSHKIHEIGYVHLVQDTPISSVVSWETDYLTTWSVVSPVCDISSIETCPGTYFRYHKHVYVYNCDCVDNIEILIRNDDLSLYELLSTSCLK